MRNHHCVKNARIQSFSDPYIPSFRLNMEIYRVNLRIQSECGKKQTRNPPNTVTLHAVHSTMAARYLTCHLDFNYLNRNSYAFFLALTLNLLGYVGSA